MCNKQNVSFLELIHTMSQNTNMYNPPYPPQQPGVYDQQPGGYGQQPGGYGQQPGGYGQMPFQPPPVAPHAGFPKG